LEIQESAESLVGLLGGLMASGSLKQQPGFGQKTNRQRDTQQQLLDNNYIDIVY